jgi:hypothetical protein
MAMVQFTWGGRGKLRASYISGSLCFIETLRNELYKAGIHKRRPPSDRIEAKITWSDHPDGRFPVKIHKDNRVEAPQTLKLTELCKE